MKNYHFSLQELKAISMVDYLEQLGHLPAKIRGNDYWYLSPLREEKEPSFKVNTNLNAWYDHGLGKGGNLIDFGILYHNCSVGELLKKMQDPFSFRPQNPFDESKKLPSPPVEFINSHIRIIENKSLAHPALLTYLQERKIPFDIASKYVEEVKYEFAGKDYFAIGLRNNSGGFELRNRYFKGSSSPKDVTLMEQNGATELAVIEGFFGFLSFQTIFQNQERQLTNFLVLNSLSFFKKNIELMNAYPKVNLYLDNDKAGDESTLHALEMSKKFTDQRPLYQGHKGLNQWLTA